MAKAEARPKSTSRGRGAVVKAKAPVAMKSVPSIAAMEQVAVEYARACVIVEVVQPRRTRKRARKQLNEALRLLISQVSCATSVVDSQVRSMVGDDGIVTIAPVAS